MHTSKPPVYPNEEHGMMQRRRKTAIENKAKKKKKNQKRKLLKLFVSLQSSYLELSTRKLNYSAIIIGLMRADRQLQYS